MFNDSTIPFTCNQNYELWFEILKYILNVAYLGIGLFLHLSILKTILFVERKTFSRSSFFQIYLMDSMASTCLLLIDIFFTRIFMYIAPLCPIVGPFFWDPSYIIKWLYAAINHGRFTKSIAQIFMVLNRMSCVLTPTNYENIWKKILPIVRLATLLLPFCGTWNVWISRVYAFSTGSGFAMDYIKNVKWASLSMFQAIFIFTAFFFTIICTSITLYKLIILADRIKSAEKSLCFTSIFISCCFLIVGGIQITFVFCSACRGMEFYIMYMLSQWTFDVYNLGTAIVMILTNRQLRDSVFCLEHSDKNGKVSVSAAQNDNKRDNNIFVHRI